MKKVILTTEQMEKITDFVSKEEISSTEMKEGFSDESSNNRYERECKFDVYGYNVTYKGFEVDSFELAPTFVSYLIDIEARSWGIKTVSLYDIKGSEELNLLVRYYPKENDDWEEEEITLKVDWDQLNEEEENGAGIITIDDTVDIELVNDSEGNIVVDKLTVVINNL